MVNQLNYSYLVYQLCWDYCQEKTENIEHLNFECDNVKKNMVKSISMYFENILKLQF